MRRPGPPVPLVRALLVLLVLLVLLGAAGCAGTRGPSNVALEGLGGRGVVVPNAPAGDAAARGMALPQAAGDEAELTSEQAEALARQRLMEAQAIWDRAVALEARDPAEAADLFEDVVSDYPEYERAAEARFREGRAWFRAADYDNASEALQAYMKLAPVNPHLAEVEELIYESGKRYLARAKGFFGIFQTDEAGLDALKYVAQTFPAGQYADDALLALGDYFLLEDEDYGTAALHYKELLLRYPDSEWSFRARLRLGDTYYLRDQGDPYAAGFVDLDPRETIPPQAALMAGPVRSALALALEQYEAYIERMEADPARLAEYAADVAYARRRRQACREGLAAKDLYRGNWYAGRGERTSAMTYWRAASTWTGTRAAETARARLRGQRTPATRRPPIAPARATPSPRVVPTAPAPRPRVVPTAPAPRPQPIAPPPSPPPPAPPPSADPPPAPPPVAPPGGALPPPQVRPGSR